MSHTSAELSDRWTGKGGVVRVHTSAILYHNCVTEFCIHKKNISSTRFFGLPEHDISGPCGRGRPGQLNVVFQSIVDVGHSGILFSLTGDVRIVHTLYTSQPCMRFTYRASRLHQHSCSKAAHRGRPASSLHQEPSVLRCPAIQNHFGDERT